MSASGCVGVCVSQTKDDPGNKGRQPTYDAEQKQNHHHEPTQPADDGAPEDAAGSGHGGVARLLGDVAGGVEADEDAGRGEVRQAPVPAGGGAGAVVRRHEGVVGRAEAVRVGGADGQPDQVHDKVEDDGEGGGVEDPAEVAGWVALVRCGMVETMGVTCEG